MPFRRARDRIQIERDLIDVMGVVYSIISDAYALESFSSQGDTHIRMTWAVGRGLLTNDEVEFYRSASRVRSDILSRDEHDRTLDSLEERTAGMIEIANRFTDRHRRLAGAKNVRFLPRKEDS